MIHTYNKKSPLYYLGLSSFARAALRLLSSRLFPLVLASYNTAGLNEHINPTESVPSALCFINAENPKLKKQATATNEDHEPSAICLINAENPKLIKQATATNEDHEQKVDIKVHLL
jgi:hypothetical protein